MVCALVVVGSFLGDMLGGLGHLHKESDVQMIEVEENWGQENMGDLADFSQGFYSCMESISTRSAPASPGGRESGNGQMDHYQYNAEVSVQNRQNSPWVEQNSNSMQNNHYAEDDEDDDDGVGIAGEVCPQVDTGNDPGGKGNSASDGNCCWRNDVRSNQTPSSKWWQDSPGHRSSPACSIESS